MRRLLLWIAALCLAPACQAQVAGPFVPIYAGGGGGGLVSAINADGWSATTQAVAQLKFQPDTAPQTIPVKRGGYDTSGNVTTYDDTVTITKQVRFPYPSYTTLNPARVALSNEIYSTDTLPGINNGSTLTAPAPIVAWVHAGDRQTLYGSTLHSELFIAGVNARNQSEAAYAQCTVSDGTHTNTVAAVGPIKLTSTTDQQVTQGYTCDNDISTITAGQFTLNADAYPWYGSAASITHSSAGTNPFFSTLTYTKSTGSRYFAYANTSTGNDSTCVASQTAATALASPCLTYVGAVNKCKTTGSDAGNCTIRLTTAQTFVTAGATTASAATSEMIVETDPAAGNCGATLQFGATNVNLNEKYVRFRCLTLSRQGAFTLTTTSGGQQAFENVAYDAANGSTSVSFNASGGTWINGMAVSNVLPTTLSLSSTQQMRLLRGISTTYFTTGPSIAPATVIGSKFYNAAIGYGASAQYGNVVIAFNKNLKMTTGTSDFFAAGSGTSASQLCNFAIVQNLIEFASSNANPALGLTRDPVNLSGICNAVVEYNTSTGAYLAGRWNTAYDNNSTSAVRNYSSYAVRHNILTQYNEKGDIYVATSGSDPTDAPLHIGNWPMYYGVNYHDNIIRYADANSQWCDGNFTRLFSQLYCGLHVQSGHSTTVPIDVQFSNDQSTTFNGTTYTAGAGDGAYDVTTGSIAKGWVGVSTLPFDLAGVARPATGDTAGAYK